MTALSGSWWSGSHDHRGVAVADCPDGNPNGFHILSVDGNRFTIRFRAAKEPEERQMRILLAPARSTEGQASSTSVSFFKAAIPKDHVGATEVIRRHLRRWPAYHSKYRIDQFGPVAMRREAPPRIRLSERYLPKTKQRKIPTLKWSRAPIFGPRVLRPLFKPVRTAVVRAVDEHSREPQVAFAWG